MQIPTMYQCGNTLQILAVVSGVSLHHLAYRKGEWDTKSPVLALIYLLLTILGTISLHFTPLEYSGLVLLSAAQFPALVLCHVAGVYGSMLLYRGFFHRLSEFRGPFLARFSNLYLTRLASKRLLVHEEVHALHQMYGDYVRVGPTELSVIDPASVEALYGSGSKTLKGPWYTLLDPRINLSFTRDKKEHAIRRKVWDQAFSTKALLTYEPVVSTCTDQFVGIIEKKRHEPINVTEWVSRFAFEVMGSFAFGRPFNTISEGGEGYFLKVIRQDMKMIAYLKHFPWLSTLFLKTPGLNKNNQTFWRWLEARFSERIEQGPQHPDIFGWILDAYMKGPQTKQDTLNLHGDGYLIVIAGSDTTSSAITNIFFNLARDRQLAEKLYQELARLSEINDQTLRSVELLDAVIYETLRLHPPVPSGLQRVTPDEGIMIGDKHIPGNVIIQVPLYTLSRDERAFVHPDKFIAERWTTRPELAKNKTAFMPFLMGPYACVGRRLALMEMRRITAEVIQRYDISFAPGQTEKAFIEGRIDTFTLVAAPLYLNFTPRPV